MSNSSNNDWRENLVLDSAGIDEILRNTSTIAVLGIKTEQQRGQPAYYVPEYLQRAGFRIFPVPVYYPDVTEILGEPVYRSVASIPEQVDLVVVFRRPQDIAQHLDDLLAAAPRAVWMQSGIREDEVARQLAASGIRVVQDRCAMVEHQRIA